MLDEGVLVDKAENVAAGDVAAHTDVLRHKVPLERSVEGIRVDALGNVNTLRHGVDVLQWSLDAVEDAAHDAGAQFNGEGLARSQDRVAHGNTG